MALPDTDALLSINQKFEKVNDWLSKCFSKNIPEYEITDGSLELLDKLRDLSEQNEKLMTVMKKDMELRSSEYAAEASRFESMLNDVLPHSSLCEDSVTFLNLLSSIQATTGLRDWSVQNAKLMLYDACRSSSDLDSELDILNLQRANVEQLLDTHQQLGKKLTRILEKDLKKDNVLEDSKELEVLKDTYLKDIEESERKIRLIEESLAERKYSPSITHEELHKKLQEIENLHIQLSDVTRSLKRYSCLPANEVLAAEEVEKTQQELDRLEQKFKEELHVSEMMKK